jgi:hypothetical protein
MYNLSYKPILVAPVLLAVLTMIGVTQLAAAQTQSDWDRGIATGKWAAEQDFRGGAGEHPSCDDHGSGAESTDFCLGFKVGYIGEWTVMGLAH